MQKRRAKKAVADRSGHEERCISLSHKRASNRCDRRVVHPSDGPQSCLHVSPTASRQAERSLLDENSVRRDYLVCYSTPIEQTRTRDDAVSACSRARLSWVRRLRSYGSFPHTPQFVCGHVRLCRNTRAGAMLSVLARTARARVRSGITLGRAWDALYYPMGTPNKHMLQNGIESPKKYQEYM